MSALLSPLLSALGPERAHRLTATFGGWLREHPAGLRLLRAVCARHDPRLVFEAMGLRFPSPVGVSAGSDRNGLLAPCFEAFGAGFVEVGTVTPRPCGVNSLPRVVGLGADDALVQPANVSGVAAPVVAWRLRNGPPLRVPVGVCVGRVADHIAADPVDDYVEAVCAVRDVASFVTLDIACPDGEDGATFESDPRRLERLLDCVRSELPDGYPVLVKLAPDLAWETLRELVNASLGKGIRGFVVANAVRSREDLTTPPGQVLAIGPGWLSGRPVRRRANLVMRTLRRHVGSSVTLVGSGGIFDVFDAIERIEAGADLVTVCTALAYRGPGLLTTLSREVARMRAPGRQGRVERPNPLGRGGDGGISARGADAAR